MQECGRRVKVWTFTYLYSAVTIALTHAGNLLISSSNRIDSTRIFNAVLVKVLRS